MTNLICLAACQDSLPKANESFAARHHMLDRLADLLAGKLAGASFADGSAT